MPSIFTRIIQGDIPSHKVGEDEQFLAFLDINPVQVGHTLVIPKKEVDRLFDLDPGTLSRMLPFAQEVAHRIRKVVPCDRIGLTVIGLEVPHAHIHLIPINGLRDMEFAGPKKKVSAEDLAALAKSIREA